MLDAMTPEAASAASETETSGVSRRGALECMILAGTGVLWALSGGVPKSLGLLGDALALGSFPRSGRAEKNERLHDYPRLPLICPFLRNPS